ncbi:acyltransferase family protein [bacterium]|nr:acyltransferase family protein [bacterium]
MTSAPSLRRNEIDALRSLATLLLIVFHTGMVFTAFDHFHLQNVQRSELIGEINLFIHQWHMPLFFLLAGMAAWYSLRTRTAGEFRLERVKRLFIPLLFGMLVIIPPQLYVERIARWVPTRKSPVDFEGSFFEWWPNTFKCCYPEANLSWHHLWFLLYLFAYSVLLAGLFVWLRGRGERRRLAVTGFLARGWMLGLPALYLAAVEALLRPSFPNNQDFVTDLANHANYPVVFLLGFLLVSDPALDDAVRRLWRGFLAIGIAVVMLPDVSAAFDSATRGVAEWLILIGLVGLGRRFMSGPIGWIQRFSGISLPFYIWHQTVIVVLAYFVIQWDAGIAVKFFAIAIPAFLITWGLSEAVALTNPTRFLFGLRPIDRSDS